MLRERLIKTHFAFFADNFLQPFRDDQIRRQNRELLMNIAGAQAQNQIARREHIPQVAMQPIQPWLIAHAPMAVAVISSAMVCPLMPGSGGSLAG